MQLISDISKHLTMKRICQTAVGERLSAFCLYFTLTKVTNEGYEYFQAEGLYSIGSGAVESAIKQIGRRVQISGAQWKRENVQVLAHRCAYLNNLIGSPLPKIKHNCLLQR